MTVARLANEGVAAHCAQAPDRLVGLGLVPLQHPDLAVEALDHAGWSSGLLGRRDLLARSGTGCAGTVELSDSGSSRSGRGPPRLGAVVFLHPFGCTLDERLDRWYLSNTVGQPVENAVALSHLIFSGRPRPPPRI